LEALFITLQAGGTSGARLHTNETELFAVMFAGEMQLQVQDITHLLRRGDAISIPPGTLHRWQNNSTKPAQLLKVVARLVP
jgi:quercetin dioxygenase-like cupin family protein